MPEGIAEIGSPTDVLIQAVKNVGQDHEGLDAGVPRLFCRRVGEVFAFEVGMLLKPACCCDYLKGISGSYKYLA